MRRAFDFGKWKAKLLLEPGRYEFMHRYVSDGQALLSHANSYTLRSFNETGEDFERRVSEEAEQFRELVTNHISEGVSEALDTLSRQMIVVATSYVEGMINEFFESIFHSYPQRTYDFLGWSAASPKGWIPLRLVLESPDKEILIDKVIRQACAAAGSGEVPSIIKRIEKLGKNKLGDDLNDKLVSLFGLRNKIVHEQYEPTLDKGDVSAAFETGDELLRFLSVVLAKNDVPIDDPTGEIQGWD